MAVSIVGTARGPGIVFRRYLPTFRGLSARINHRVRGGFNLGRVRIASRIFRDGRSIIFHRTRGQVRAVGTIVITALNRWLGVRVVG